MEILVQNAQIELNYELQYQDDLPQSHKDAMIAKGIDPSTIWNSLALFGKVSDAINACDEEHFENDCSFRTFRVINRTDKSVLY